MQDANPGREAGQHEVERDGGAEAHRGADERDADLGGDLGRLNFFAGADAAERGHHAEHRAEQAEQRAALDRGGDPIGAVFEVAHHVALEDFHDDLPQLIVAKLAIADGELDELRQRAGVVAGELFDEVEAAGLQFLHDVVDEFGLLVVVAEAELLHAAKAHDDVVEAPQKVEGQKAVTGIAQIWREVVDTHRENLFCSCFRRRMPLLLD